MEHKTRDGVTVSIKDMSISHLKNTINCLKRRAKEGILVQYGGTGSLAEDHWYDEDELEGKEAWDYLNIDVYIAELATRKEHGKI